MTQVAATLTPSDVSSVAGAFVYAYKILFGRDPPRPESWIYPLSVSALETAHWSQMYNWNAGNVTDGTCHGRVRGDVGTYRNPHVTDALNFSAFSSLGEGARAEMATLLCMGAMDAADAGDLAGFQHALQTGCYAGCVPYPDLSAYVRQFRNVVPSNYFPNSRKFVIAGSIVILGGALAYAIHEGAFDSVSRDVGRMLDGWTRDLVDRIS
jgi:hypothetical protein